MRYTFNILDVLGNIVEQGLSSEEEAATVIGILQQNGIDTASYTINKIEHYTVKGLGRDPDLH
jgi:hypothetical protein